MKLRKPNPLRQYIHVYTAKVHRESTPSYRLHHVNPIVFESLDLLVHVIVHSIQTGNEEIHILTTLPGTGGDAIEARRRVPPQISRPGGTLWSVPPQILVVASSNEQNLRRHA